MSVLNAKKVERFGEEALALPSLAVAVIAQKYFAGETPPNPYRCGGKLFWWSVDEQRRVYITDDPLVDLVRQHDAS